MLESLDKLGFSQFKQLINLIIPKSHRRQNSIIIIYIRIYTQLNNAFNLVKKESCNRAFEHLLIAKKIIKRHNFREESDYLKRINSIINQLIKNKGAIIAQIRKDDASDPHHVKTSVLLAQNICILRILKINKY